MSFGYLTQANQKLNRLSRNNMQPSTPKHTMTSSMVTPKATKVALQGIVAEGQTEFPKKDNGSRPNTKSMTPKLTHNKDDHSA